MGPTICDDEGTLNNAFMLNCSTNSIHSTAR